MVWDKLSDLNFLDASVLGEEGHLFLRRWHHTDLALIWKSTGVVWMVWLGDRRGKCGGGWARQCITIGENVSSTIQLWRIDQVQRYFGFSWSIYDFWTHAKVIWDQPENMLPQTNKHQSDETYKIINLFTRKANPLKGKGHGKWKTQLLPVVIAFAFSEFTSLAVFFLLLPHVWKNLVS